MPDNVRLCLGFDAPLDWLMAYEFGRVDDGQPPGHWVGVTRSFGFLLDEPDGRIVGFKVLDFSAFDPEAVSEIWEGPRFDVPVLGLRDATAGEVALGAASHFQGRSSVGRELFQAAIGLEGQEAISMWRRCLEAGDAMAHFGLGYSLYAAGHHPEAYRHLRYYSEIAPHGAWTWRWYGLAAEAMGEFAEAREAYLRAVGLTEAGEEETDAAELLSALDGRVGDLAASGGRIVLWGDEYPELELLGIDELSADAAVGLTAGAKPKAYGHTDPNEDAVAIVIDDGTTLLVCADGHNGAASTRAAVGTVLEWFAENAAPWQVSDDELIDLWEKANTRVIVSGAAAGQPESRTTLVVAIVGNGIVRWAAMGDSLLSVVHEGGRMTHLTKRVHHFVGWPMSRQDIAARLLRGTVELGEDAWVVAASDGFTDFVPGVGKTLASEVQPGRSAVDMVERLVDAACAGGAGDNVAVGVVRVAGAPSEAVSDGGDERVADRIRGCFLGGAVGDALGAPVEFDVLDKIWARFGPEGLQGFAEAYGRRGTITDDTQMTLFTAEGLVRAALRSFEKGIRPDIGGVVDHAYARWLLTQGETSTRWTLDPADGWLIGQRGLHALRAPGNTCLSALRASRAGSIAEPINNSKGCGAVMRAAPVGLTGPRFELNAFAVGSEIGALTHGHPSGYWAAGALSQLVAHVVWDGLTLDEAVSRVLVRLSGVAGGEELSEALRGARYLAAGEAPPGPSTVAALGAGWVAEEALAISVYCALVAESFEHGVLLAVNHGGDSDSTGAITGNLLGARLGLSAVPDRWLAELELRAVIERLAEDWVAIFVDAPGPDLSGDASWWERYPGW